MDGGRARATIGTVVLLGCCALAPWAHATAKCLVAEDEERAYELVEIEAVDGGSVPETVRMRWAEGVTVHGGIEDVRLDIPAIGETVSMERVAGR